ncbi:MAG: peptidylprolyl isomerase [Prolixibacteraceae bacterium]|nr:peptidylprolyl isomerase [Prolixibacteraceae bacterium]
MQNNKPFVAFLLLFNIFSFSAFSQGKNIDQIIAIVGDNIILKSDIEAVHLQNQAQGKTSEGDMKCEILEDLMVEKLLVAEAQLDTTIEVTPSQINQQLNMRIDYFTQHLGSQQAVEEYFKKPIATIKADLRDVIENEILSSQMRNKIIENLKATPSEVRYFYRNLTDDEKPVIPTQYEYAQITLQPEVEEEEENRIKTELRKIKKRVEDGENFTMFAVLYSEGPSASDGGDLGYFGRSQMDPAFSQAAFNLKPGQISNVVRSDFGYHLIQMIDREGDKVRCRHIIMKPKIDTETKEKALQAMDSLVNDIRAEKISFAEAAMRFSTDKDTRNSGGLVVDEQTMSSKFEIDQLPPDVSKKLASLNINEISDPFLSVNMDNQREEIKIVKLIDKIEQHKANLSEDYPMLSEMFLQKKQNEVIQEWISNRQAKTYIQIDPTYQNCNFNFENWIK